jgi:hypothetical protein
LLNTFCFVLKGEKQTILINFDDKYIQIKEIHVKFQGGFSSSLCHLEYCSAGKFVDTKICDFYPEDNNSNQVRFFFFCYKFL